MVDISAIASGVAALNGIKNLAQTMIGLRDAEAFQQKRFEFQALIIEAQNSVFAANEERSALIEQIDQLKAKVARLETWEAEKQKYQLTDIGQSSFAYALKEQAGATEPMHHICANCYEDGHRSILQKQERPHSRTALFCQRCGQDIWPWGGGGDQPPPTVNRGSTWVAARKGR